MNHEKKRKQGAAQWIVFALVTAGLLISIVLGVVSSHIANEAEKETVLTEQAQADRLSIPEIPRSEPGTTFSERTERPAIDVSIMTRSTEPTVIGGYVEYLTEAVEG